jgi:hypothetical protein
MIRSNESGMTEWNCRNKEDKMKQNHFFEQDVHVANAQQAIIARGDFREFQIDPNRSEENRERHGISFVEALPLWDDPNLVEFTQAVDHRARSVVIGKIGEERWTGFVMHEAGRVRILSVRKAQDKELRVYAAE